MDIKIKEYYKKLCIHKFDNLDKMDQFLKDTVKAHTRMNHWNRSISTKEI